MKVKVEKSDLSLATTRSQGAIMEKVLATIALKACSNKLRVMIADRIIAIYSNVDSNIEVEGEAFIPARIFSDVVRELPDGLVTLEKKDKYLLITAGDKSEFLMKLPLLEDKRWRDAPVIESQNCAKLPSNKLHYMIDQIQFCLAHESPRNYGAVGFFHKAESSKLRLVGTDGFRLSFSELNIELPQGFLEAGICISKRALHEVQKMCGEGFDNIKLLISNDNTTLAAIADGYEIYVRLSAVKYPNYESVLPSTDLYQVEVSRPYIQSVTKRVLLAADKTKALQLCFSDSLLTLKSRTIGSSEGKESLILDDYSSENVDLAINGKFLTDVFSTISSDQISFNFKTEDDPIVLFPKKGQEPDNCRSMHVLVPIKEAH